MMQKLPVSMSQLEIVEYRLNGISCINGEIQTTYEFGMFPSITLCMCVFYTFTLYDFSKRWLIDLNFGNRLIGPRVNHVFS